MSKPVRTTLVYGLISGVLLFPAAHLLTPWGGWPDALKLVLWVDVALYALFLARWSSTRLLKIAFPLAIFLGAALWPGAWAGFLALGLGVFSWVRSGVCFSTFTLRPLLAEVLTALGGAGLVAVCRPGTTLSWALAVWLFFLVQALYFFFIPGPVESFSSDPSEEAFRSALRVAEKILDATPH